MESAPYVDPGHTVLAIPVPQLDAYVRARTQHYDLAYLADDPAFGQAHVTLLAPWQRTPTATELGFVADLARRTEPFDYRLDRLAMFGDGIIHLLADPAQPFAAMTQQLRSRFPDNIPYDGRFEHVVPHVTLDALGPQVDLVSVRASLGGVVPARCRAEQIQLQWWQAGRCHVRRTWQLGGAGRGDGAEAGER